MKALDTNVIIRFLIRDDAKQANLIYRLLDQAEDNKEEFYISILVVLETIWVLESVYEVKRKDILNSLNSLMLMPVFIFEKQSIVREFLQNAEKSKYDLSDMLISYSAKEATCTSTLTFDKKAAKFHLFELLK